MVDHIGDESVIESSTTKRDTGLQLMTITDFRVESSLGRFMTVVRPETSHESNRQGIVGGVVRRRAATGLLQPSRRNPIPEPCRNWLKSRRQWRFGGTNKLRPRSLFFDGKNAGNRPYPGRNGGNFRAMHFVRILMHTRKQSLRVSRKAFWVVLLLRACWFPSETPRRASRAVLITDVMVNVKTFPLIKSFQEKRIQRTTNLMDQSYKMMNFGGHLILITLINRAP